MALGLALFVAAAPTARAQTDPAESDIDSAGLLIEASAGWDGTVDRSTPVAVSFLLRNDADGLVRGRLVLTDPINDHDVVLGEVVLAAHSARRFSAIQNLSDWEQCRASFVSGTDILWRRDLSILSGSEFVPNVNYALFIDDGGRRLEFPNSTTSTAVAGTVEMTAVGARGLPIKSLSVKTWQVPGHPGPLSVAQAIVFPETAVADDLNDVQWRSIAEWMCQGGVIYVHQKSEEVLQRLAGAAPLPVEPADLSGEFQVQRAGVGAIYQYADPLLPSENAPMRQLLGESIARLSALRLTRFVDAVNWYGARGGRAQLNRVVVLGFFLLYGVVSGLVPLVLYRLSQRRIAIYAVSIVTLAATGAGLLGGYLRMATGDLHALTVTQGSPGGLVQIGDIDVQSAGGRNTRAAVRGERVDLQYTGTAPNPYMWNTPETGYPAFTWQSNLAQGVADTYEVNVPMTPWGHRRLYAVAYQRGPSPLEVQLTFQPANPPATAASPDPKAPQGDPSVLKFPPGTCTLKVVNHLPFDLKNCWLFIGMSRTADSIGLLSQANMYQPGAYWRRFNNRRASPAGDLVDVSMQVLMQPVRAGATMTRPFDPMFRVQQNGWERMLNMTDVRIMPPEIARLGTAGAWIVAEIEDSPIITIDRERTDFVPQEELHLYVQEIPAEELPEVFRAVEPADSGSDATGEP
ncbi:MAG: hypothetical protein U0992_04835 [Planctomycetaceae bacterium]